tara:strand:+ start:959 stop:1510 length:552 start_codon:yes stop_codon:yes gene_type:complete
MLFSAFGSTKPFWDLDENGKRVKKGGYTFVVNRYIPNEEETVDRLLNAKKIEIRLKNAMRDELKKGRSKKFKNHMKHFIETQHRFFEMPLKNAGFYGLNKPKNVHMTNKPPVGKDGRKRPSYRVVMLTIRNTKGKVESCSKFLKLLIHELSHTLANHVTWRPDDHGKDFKDCENLMWKMLRKK